VKVGRLPLNAHAKDKLLRLVGERYNPENDILTIMTDRCPHRQQNLDYALYLLTALFHESWVSESHLFYLTHTIIFFCYPCILLILAALSPSTSVIWDAHMRNMLPIETFEMRKCVLTVPFAKLR
jgi:hypothetical protein